MDGEPVSGALRWSAADPPRPDPTGKAKSALFIRFWTGLQRPTSSVEELVDAQLEADYGA